MELASLPGKFQYLPAPQVEHHSGCHFVVRLCVEEHDGQDKPSC